MCGRAACTLAPGQLRSRVCKEYHNCAEFRGESEYHPSYNVCPTEVAPVARQVIEEDDKECGETVLQSMHWGLMTSPNKPINARVERLEDVAMFRRLLDRNRCVMYVSGFYEWDRHDDKEKKPYFVRAARVGATPGEVHITAKKEAKAEGSVKQEVEGKRVEAAGVKKEGEEKKVKLEYEDDRVGFDDDASPLLPMAGFWTRTKSEGGEEDVFSFTLITMPATKAFSSVHHRIPAILQSPEEVREWLDVQHRPWSSVKHFLRPAEGLVWYRVDPKVGKNTIKSADCIEPYVPEPSKQMTLHAFFGPTIKKQKMENGEVKVKVEGDEKNKNGSDDEG